MEADEVRALARRLARCELRPFAGSHHDADFVFEVDDAALRELDPDALVAVLTCAEASGRARERALDGLRLQGDLAAIQRGFDVPDSDTRSDAWRSAMRVLGPLGIDDWSVRAASVRTRRISALPAVRAAAHDEAAQMLEDLRRGDTAAWHAPSGAADPTVAALGAQLWKTPADPPSVETLLALPPMTRELFGAYGVLLVGQEAPHGPALMLAMGVPGGRAALEALAATATGAFGDAVRAALAG